MEGDGVSEGSGLRGGSQVGEVTLVARRRPDRVPRSGLWSQVPCAFMAVRSTPTAAEAWDSPLQRL